MTSVLKLWRHGCPREPPIWLRPAGRAKARCFEDATAAYTEMLPTRTSAGKRQNLLVPPPRGAMKWPSHVARA